MKQLTLIACSLIAVAAGCAGDPTAEDDADDIDAPAEADMLSTPNGLVHHSCIHEIGDDDTIDDDGLVTRPDGTTYQLAACNYPTLPNRLDVAERGDDVAASSDDDVESSDGDAEVTTASKVIPDDNNWIEAAWWHSPHWMKSLHGRFKVPSNPSRKGSQTIFLFPSFEPKAQNAIIQPVLQWGPSAAGGGRYWAIASWYVKPGYSVHGPLKRVGVQDTLSGAMTSSQCTTSGHCTWKVVTKDLSHAAASSTINVKTKVPYIEVQGGVLEVYNVKSCSEYPADGLEGFYDLTFADHIHTVKPAFSKIYWNRNCNESIIANSSLVFLNWN